VEKIRAAKQAQRTAELVVIGRTEAFIAGRGVDEALARAAAYAEAGADAVLVHSRASTPEEIWAFMERWDRDVPVVVVPTTYRASFEELQSRGVRMAIHANVGIRAAARAMEQAFLDLHQLGTVSPSLEARLASVDELLELQGCLPSSKPGDDRRLRPGRRVERRGLPDRQRRACSHLSGLVRALEEDRRFRYVPAANEGAPWRSPPAPG